jgi:alpha-galactosidase
VKRLSALLGGALSAVLVTAALATTAAATTTAAPAKATVANTVLSPTPYMGWNTYYGLGGDFTEATIRSVADSMVSRGLKKAGYDIVWLDGGWQADESRSAAGDLVPNPAKFPNGLKPLVDYIHSKA